MRVSFGILPFLGTSATTGRNGIAEQGASNVAGASSSVSHESAAPQPVQFYTAQLFNSTGPQPLYIPTNQSSPQNWTESEAAVSSSVSESVEADASGSAESSAESSAVANSTLHSLQSKGDSKAEEEDQKVSVLTTAFLSAPSVVPGQNAPQSLPQNLPDQSGAGFASAPKASEFASEAPNPTGGFEGEDAEVRGKNLNTHSLEIMMAGQGEVFGLVISKAGDEDTHLKPIKVDAGGFLNLNDGTDFKGVVLDKTIFQPEPIKALSIQQDFTLRVVDSLYSPTANWTSNGVLKLDGRRDALMCPELNPTRIYWADDGVFNCRNAVSVDLISIHLSEFLF